MNADALRHFYDYHFSENRNLWKSYIMQISQEQFTRDADYSHGSIRDQIFHLISVDDTWFSDLRGVALPEPLDPADFPNLESIRAHWDTVEKKMRGYLAELRDDMLADKPLSGEDENLALWQILLHVVNHGTDHRAQILRLLNDLGVKTVSQDYIFYVYEHPV
ncbi:MAG: DinB family protein [Ardenticatenaceae bacterium]|nr:DinB family protein [Ardenticatenaceae bacterium]